MKWSVAVPAIFQPMIFIIQFAVDLAPGVVRPLGPIGPGPLLKILRRRYRLKGFFTWAFSLVPPGSPAGRPEVAG